MKSAMIALAVIGLGIFGLLLISLFGDITVTNQQDYVLMKNSVEAAMYDSVDKVSYMKGFCVCVNNGVNETQGGTSKFVFNSTNDYTIKTLYDDNNDCSKFTTNGEYKTCEKMIGEFKINKELFAESFVRRFSENVKGSKDYKIIIHDIIEYPPKVSVEVRSYNNSDIYDSTQATFDSSDFDIVNKIDSIFEDR